METNFRLLIVTGMSGAGKTQVMQALEDMGYFCVDNLPPVLIPKFSEVCRQAGSRLRRVALVVDIRGGEFFDSLSDALTTLKAMQVPYEIVFMDATDETLVRRYKESRRSHPLAPEGRITAGLQKERSILESIRHRADYIIDTTQMKTANLKQYLRKTFEAADDNRQRLAVTVLSFGFKHGVPMDADMIWDVRFLPNPYYIPELRHHTGCEKCVQEYVMSFEQSRTLLEKLKDLLDFLIPLYIQEGKSRLVIAFGCTGGKHRSITFTELIGDYLISKGMHVVKQHRDIGKDRP